LSDLKLLLIHWRKSYAIITKSFRRN